MWLFDLAMWMLFFMGMTLAVIAFVLIMKIIFCGWYD
jgi:hypothetical protein